MPALASAVGSATCIEATRLAGTSARRVGGAGGSGGSGGIAATGGALGTTTGDETGEATSSTGSGEIDSVELLE